MIIITFMSYKYSYSQGITAIIKEFCLNEFKKESNYYDSKIDISIGEFTCDCFIDKIDEGHIIKNAKEICKKKATKKFSL